MSVDSLQWLLNKPVQTRRYEERLSELDMLLLHEQFFKDWCRNKTKPILNSCRNAGKCTNECSFFNLSLAPDVFICKTTGRLHHCTSASCQSIQFTKEHRVCTITGYMYELEMTLPMTHDYVEFNYSNIDKDKGNSKKMIKQRALLQPKTVDKLIEEVKIQQDFTVDELLDELRLMSGLEIKEEDKQLIVKTETTIAIKEETSLMIIEPETVIKKALRPKHPKRLPVTDLMIMKTQKKVFTPPTKKLKKEKLICVASAFLLTLIPTLPASEAHRIGHICLYLWTQVITTDYYIQVKGRYRYLPHVAAVLWNAIDGVRLSDNRFIVEPEPVLRALLPKAKDIEMYGVKARDYTKTCRYFHEIIRELKSS